MKIWLVFPLLLSFSFVHAATKVKPASQPTETNTAQAAVPVTSANNTTTSAFSELGPVAKGAAQSGIRRCLPRIDQVVSFVTAGTQSGAMVFAAPIDADNRQSSVALEVLGNNGLTYIDTGYAPTVAACDAMYQSVTYWTNPCDEVARVAFPSFKKTGSLRQYIAVLDGGPSAKVFLMPAGTGCVSIKKEVLF